MGGAVLRRLCRPGENALGMPLGVRFKTYILVSAGYPSLHTGLVQYAAETKYWYMSPYERLVQ